MSAYNVITSDFVNVSITNSGHNSYCIERRFQKGITIDEFKVRVYCNSYCILLFDICYYIFLF